MALVWRRLQRRLLLMSRGYRGGFGRRNVVIGVMAAYVPNSANWQTMGSRVVLGINRLPSLLLGLRESLGSPERTGEIGLPSDALLSSTLKDLFDRYGSDKGRNGYSSLYAGLLTDRLKSNSPIRIMEIGIGTIDPRRVSTMAYASAKTGGSLRAWASLAPQISVVGIDDDATLGLSLITGRSLIIG